MRKHSNGKASGPSPRKPTDREDKPAVEVVVAQGYARGIGSAPQLGSSNTNRQRKLFMASKTSEILKVPSTPYPPIGYRYCRESARCLVSPTLDESDNTSVSLVKHCGQSDE